MPETGDTVSVVIPTHLRAEFLGDAIRSVLTQTHPVSEVVVVSDVPDADAAAVSASAAETSPIPVRYVERVEGPRGASGSRNHGAALTTGDVIGFLDDDDIWEIDFVAKCMDAMTKGHVDLGVSWIVEFSDQHEKPGHSMDDGLRADQVLAINPGITGSNFLIRRPAFVALGGFDQDLPVKNDTDFFARFLREGRTYAVVPERLLRQRKHRTGQLTAVNEARARGTELFMAKHKDYLSPSDRRELRQLVHRIRSRCSPHPVARAYHLAWVAALYGPTGLIRKLRSGRQKSAYEVAGFSEPQT
ncbi:glycosyltransferase family 2 protein [Microbacterium testaceum]|nr:glycosyltransferase family 2 protein [Microbacterium testaceum]